jgi:hypothetical protein
VGRGVCVVQGQNESGENEEDIDAHVAGGAEQPKGILQMGVQLQRKRVAVEKKHPGGGNPTQPGQRDNLPLHPWDPSFAQTREM